MPIRKQSRPKVEIRDTTISALPTLGEGLPLELAKALHEMAKAASILAAKCDTFGSVGILVGDIVVGGRNDA